MGFYRLYRFATTSAKMKEFGHPVTAALQTYQGIVENWGKFFDPRSILGWVKKHDNFREKLPKMTILA